MLVVFLDMTEFLKIPVLYTCHSLCPDLNKEKRDFAVAQWLRLCIPNAGGPGSIPGQGTRSHVPPLRVRMPQLRSPPAATKTWRNQINQQTDILRKEYIGSRQCIKESNISVHSGFPLRVLNPLSLCVRMGANTFILYYIFKWHIF